MDLLGTHKELLSSLLPGETVQDLTILEGQFHLVVMGSTRVVCFPRTKLAATRLPARAAVLESLAGLELGFNTPAVLDDIRSSSGEPICLVLSRVPGTPIAPEALKTSKLTASTAEQYAELFRGLASAGADPRIRAALPTAQADRWQRFAADVRAELFPLMSPEGLDRAADELAALDLLPHRTDAVVHGDLGGENVLWQDTDTHPLLSGVIDWDEVCLGDPAEDFAAVAASYGEDLLDRILTSTQNATDEMAARIQTIRGTFALQQALSAYRDEDEEELADGLLGYR